MTTGSDFSVECLFAQLVSRRLQSSSRVSRMTDSSAFSFEPEDDFPFVYPSSSVDIVHRLSNLEVAVASIAGDMKKILMRLTLDDVGQVRLREPDIVVPIKSPCSSSGSSPSVSPHGFQFVCPLCLKPQLTPKSHCEHLKNTVDVGVHVCRFILDHSRHHKIMTTFGSAELFVQW